MRQNIGASGHVILLRKSIMGKEQQVKDRGEIFTMSSRNKNKVNITGVGWDGAMGWGGRGLWDMNVKY